MRCVAADAQHLVDHRPVPAARIGAHREMPAPLVVVATRAAPEDAQVGHGDGEALEHRGSRSGAARAPRRCCPTGTSFGEHRSAAERHRHGEKRRARLLARRLRVRARPRVDEPVARARRRHVEEPALLIDGDVAGRRWLRHEVIGQLQIERRRGASLPAALGASRQKHDRPLEPLRPVRGEQHDAVLDRLDARELAGLAAVAEHARGSEARC